MNGSTEVSSIPTGNSGGMLPDRMFDEFMLSPYSAYGVGGYCTLVRRLGIDPYCHIFLVM